MAGLPPRRRSFGVLVHQETCRFALHHFAGQIRVEELGQPRFDLLKTPESVGLRRQLPANNAQDDKVE